MRFTNRFAGGVFFCIFCLGSGGPEVYAQTSGRVFLAEELQSLEKTLKTPDLSQGDRYEALIRKAQLFQLMGNLEGAAQSWTEAARAQQDHRALLEGAFCFFAMGEMEKAETGVKTILQAGKDKDLLCRAKYLEAQIEAFQSGDLSLLMELISDPEYERYKPVIYYTLWKFSGADRYKTRLLAEYPRSPEALIVRDAVSSKTAVKVSPSAMWLLFPGRESLILEVPGDSDRKPAALQTGLFGKEENAKAMAERLKTAGFEAVINRRTANDGGVYWVITVPAGRDINRTITQLKDKGFDSFPIF